MKHKLYLLLSNLVLISLLLAAYGSPAATQPPAPAETEALVATEAPTGVPAEAIAPTATPEPPGPLTVLIDNDEGPIIPANFNTFIGFWMIGWVYDSLYIRTPGLEPIPFWRPQQRPVKMDSPGLLRCVKASTGMTANPSRSRM